MRERLRKWARRAVPVVVLLSLGLPRATAQEGEQEKPFQEPGITYRETQKPYIQWAVGTFLILAVLAVAFKNPHRTHLD